MPAYIGAMLCAAAIRNIWDAKNTDLPMEEIDGAGGPLPEPVSGDGDDEPEAVAVSRAGSSDDCHPACSDRGNVPVCNYAVFNIMGRDYEAAAMTTAFCGFGMGATPNAMANMRALQEKYGPAPRAFFIVPLVGSLFVDFFNSMVLTTFMNVL